MLRYGVAFVVAIALPVLLAQSGMFVKLGAHPWWAVQVALIGAPIGALVAMAPFTQGKRLLLGLVVLALCAGAAYYGKTQFAASFAEDAFAGRMWYFGWIGIAAGDAIIVAALVFFVLPDKSEDHPH